MELFGQTMGSEIPEGAVVVGVALVAEVLDEQTGRPTLYLSLSTGLTSWGAAGLLMAGFDQARRDVANGWEPEEQ